MFSKGNFVIACDQVTNNAVLYDLDKSENLDECEVWELNTSLKSARNISGIKYREGTVYGDVVLVAASHGLAGIYKYPEKECVWKTDDCGNNPHSIEVLPCGAVVTTCSTGGETRIYDTETSEYVSYPNIEGHGLLWDPDREVLWALDKFHLYIYKVNQCGRGGTLEEIRKIELPCDWGHDLSADATDKNYLNITTGKYVYHFNKTTEEFEMFTGDLNPGNCKGYGNNRLGNTVYCKPNGGVDAPWGNSDYHSWCTDEIYFYKDGTLRCYKSKKRAFYKVFSMIDKYN